MKKSFITSLVLVAALPMVFASSVNAAGSGYGKESVCQIVYGGGETCPPSVKFTLDKKVQSSNKGGAFVDNVTVNDMKFQAGQTVNFQITVYNTGKDTIKNLEVSDVIPQYLEFVSGAGNYNKDTKTVTFTVETLEPGKSAAFIITTKVVAEASLPQDKGIVCTTNTAQAQESKGATATDSSEVCIQKQTPGSKTPVMPKTPVKTIPETGPELFGLAALIPSGALGVYLRRKTKLG